MADLIGRNLDDRIAQALKMRAAPPEHGPEAEQRAILHQALRPREKCLAQVLASIPKGRADENAELSQQADISVHWLPACP